jgi:hypothetical protein
MKMEEEVEEKIRNNIIKISQSTTFFKKSAMMQTRRCGMLMRP